MTENNLTMEEMERHIKLKGQEALKMLLDGIWKPVDGAHPVFGEGDDESFWIVAEPDGIDRQFKYIFKHTHTPYGESKYQLAEIRSKSDFRDYRVKLNNEITEEEYNAALRLATEGVEENRRREKEENFRNHYRTVMGLF